MSRKTGVAEVQVTYAAADPIVRTLGGSQMISTKHLQTDYDKAALARKGLPKKSATHLQALLRLTSKQMSDLLAISYRTFQRKEEDDLLDQYSSEHLIEIAEVVSHALDIFGSYDSVVEWMLTPLVGLDGLMPIRLLDNTFNLRLVRQALGRLEHGIFA